MKKLNLTHFWSILYFLNTPENFWFSGVFRGYEMRILARNGLIFEFVLGMGMNNLDKYQKFISIYFTKQISVNLPLNFWSAKFAEWSDFGNLQVITLKPMKQSVLAYITDCMIMGNLPIFLNYRNSHFMGLGTNIVMSEKNIHDSRFNYKHCFRIIDFIKNY